MIAMILLLGLVKNELLCINKHCDGVLTHDLKV